MKRMFNDEEVHRAQLLAMEWGFKAHEKGMNFYQARIDFEAMWNGR